VAIRDSAPSFPTGRDTTNLASNREVNLVRRAQ
jgi:hypothetical protein